MPPITVSHTPTHAGEKRRRHTHSRRHRTLHRQAAQQLAATASSKQPAGSSQRRQQGAKEQQAAAAAATHNRQLTSQPPSSVELAGIRTPAPRSRPPRFAWAAGHCDTVRLARGVQRHCWLASSSPGGDTPTPAPPHTSSSDRAR